MTAAIVTVMGDKSPKAKQRDQKQKAATKASGAVQARTKQDGYSHPAAPTFKGRK